MRHWPQILVFVAGCGVSTPPPVAPVRLVALSNQTVMTLSGERTDLGRVTDGRVALVSLWATWCEACTKEIDALNRLARKTSERQDAMVVGVAVGESAASVEAFARSREMKYVQLVDADFSLADALGQRSVPATLVIDRAGHVVYRGEVLDGAALLAFRKALGSDP
jgi:peroxiredoxin